MEFDENQQEIIEKDLENRYGIDRKQWRRSYRSGYIFQCFASGMRVQLFLLIPIMLHSATLEFANSQEWRRLFITLGVSVFGYYLTDKMIPLAMLYHSKANLVGKDFHKEGSKSKPPIPEGIGLVPAFIFLSVVIVMLFLQPSPSIQVNMNCMAGMVTISLTVFLGFIDDVMELPWRYKLILPTIGMLPLLAAFDGFTTIVTPRVLHPYTGTTVDLGPILYKLIMLVIGLFCVNSINIYAGVNGLQIGQSIINAITILLHNIIQTRVNSPESIPYQRHMLSASIMLPFIFISLALFKYNKFPARIFVGDTYTLFAGIIFGVVGIICHFSKTLLLIFLPQILNFFLSFPQLLRFQECPKHRQPRLDKHSLRLETVQKHWTLINLVLRVIGPTNEHQLFQVLMLFQGFSCGLGLTLRYLLSVLLF